MGKLAYGVIVGLGAVLAGCGGSALTTKVVDTPQGTSNAYGAPRNQMYSFEAEPELDQLRLHLYRAARCDVIPTEIVARRTETYKGSELVSSVDQGPVQIAKAATAEVPCDQGYARDVEVSLVVGNAIHPLGVTDAYGYVGVNLSAELREKLLGTATPPNAMVRVRAMNDLIVMALQCDVTRIITYMLDNSRSDLVYSWVQRRDYELQRAVVVRLVSAAAAADTRG